MEKIYEVLRVLEGKPVFLKEHLDRLQKSWEFYNQEAMDLTFMEKQIVDLAAQRQDPHNLRIEVEVGDGAYTLQTVEGTYPTEEMKKEGVLLATFEHLRHNPQVKFIDPQLIERAKSYREEKGVYSLLYVYGGEVGECERANIFFIRDGVLITAKDEDVLLGVTRQKVLDIAQKLNITVVKRTVRTDELFTMEGAFMSGTSIHVLPVRKIDGFYYDVDNLILQQLSEEMDRMIYQEKKVEEEVKEERDFFQGESMKSKKLYRSDDARLAGVCGGIGEYFGIDSNVVRLAWLLFAVMGGSGVLAYIIAALVIPKRNGR
ncbi:MAG: PspC domain-containing protein [Tissierellia bacterium]|nr:PspC domain-containing protein [Tissierellia bacterium]